MTTGRLVLFDLDNTLVDRAGGFRAWAEDFLTRRALMAGGELEWLEAQDEDGFAPRSVLFERVRDRYGLAETAEVLTEQFRQDYFAFFPPLDASTARGLRRLRAAGWKIGIVTNGSVASQQTKIDYSGLREFVDGWCISEAAGCRKPDPEIFQLAARSCGASLENAWMVGDHSEADISGAIAAGLNSIWIRRGRTWNIPFYRPTGVADSVFDAVDHILGNRPAAPDKAHRTVVTLYHSPGCHLCGRARDVLLAAQEEFAFELAEVDITGDPALEARHREWLPVVEVDGERAFVYHVDAGGLRRRLARAE